jgi:hypothetical protein
LEVLNRTIDDAQVTLANVKQEEEFTITALAAQADDRESFDKLRELALQKDYRFANLAANAWTLIFEAHNGPMSLSNIQTPWPQGVDPAKLSLSQLSALYQSAPTPVKPGILEYTWNRNDIPSLDRLDFMMSVMKSDHSLTAAEYAGRYFTQGTGQKIKPMAVDYLASWWVSHRQDYQNK